MSRNLEVKWTGLVVLVGAVVGAIYLIGKWLLGMVGVVLPW